MALNQFGAGFTLTGQDMASPVVQRVNRAFMGMQKIVSGGANSMGKSMSALAIGFAAMKIGTGLMGIAKGSADAAGKFEQGLAGVAAVSRATTEEQIQLHDKALESAMKSQFSPDDAVEGLKNLATAGLKASEQIAVLDPVLDLAAGSMGQLGLAGAANAVVGTVKAMGYEVSQASMVTDKLLKITQLTNFQTNDFEVGLSRAASTAKIYGQSLNDTLIQMGLLRNLNIEASVASTSLREAWRRLATDEQAQEEVAKRKVDIFDQQTGKIRPLLDVMSDMAVKTKDLNDAERMRMATIAFGVRGMAAYNAVSEAQQTVMIDGIAIVLKGADAINALRFEMLANGEAMDESTKATLRMALGVEDLEKHMKTSTGTAEMFRLKLLDTYLGQKQLIDGGKQALAVVTGEAAAKLFKPFAAAYYAALGAMVSFMNSIPIEARQALIGIVSALGTFIALVGGIILITGAMNMMGLSIGGIVFMIGKILLFSAPAMVLVAGLAVGIYALYRAFQLNVGGIGTSWAEMVERFKVGAAVISSIIKGEGFSDELNARITESGMWLFVAKFENFWERMRSFWDGVKTGFAIGVEALANSPAFMRLKETISGVLALFTGTDMKDSQNALEDWQEKGKTAGMKLAALGEIAADVFNKIVELGSGFLTFVGNLEASDLDNGISNLTATFTGLWEILNVVNTAFMGILNTIRLIVASVIEFIGHLWNIGRVAGIVIGERASGGKLTDIRSAQESIGIDVFSGNYSATGSAMSALADTYTSEAARVARKEESQGELGNRTANAEALLNLRDRKSRIEEWVNSSTALFRAKTKGTDAEGNLSFSEASTSMQREQLLMLERVAKSIEKMTKQPVTLNIDGEKFAEIVGRQSSFTGEDGLSDTPNFFSEF